ncbi:MAG: hypothetical protein QM773_13415 [Hyphomonadaceae bacterium]
MTQKNEVTLNALVAKRDHLLVVRRNLQSQIKAVDAAIDHLAHAIRLFESDDAIFTAAAKLDRKGAFKIRRFIIDILREAAAPLDPRQIAEALMAVQGLDPTTHNYRLVRQRIAACLYKMRADGVAQSVPVERSNAMHWRLSEL